jgi:hypothetical protein
MMNTNEVAMLHGVLTTLAYPKVPNSNRPSVVDGGIDPLQGFKNEPEEVDEMTLIL